ncbi:sulfite exporter TauE/SafE family protein [Sulfurospirillum multivorans]|uniref:Probable membrane transporter protein n=2 Tax=Sulfurospirillum multivorans TaxID=66821 RepID=A0AA86E0U2_SULMK|nr:sulfite exporter TauE/SafE family protein [Sulfurospirillum multivorans]AHJ14350.1 putative exporter [Sulfurospirillum multivorans DSM 12446]QEH07835.1 putative exporter [Sulfurospirillum multivorans]
MKKESLHTHVPFKSFLGGLSVSTLGGLIGLGGAEFRLPLLVGYFGFSTLLAIMMNKLTSLATVLFSLIFRVYYTGAMDLYANISTVIVLLIGSMIGAWVGAHYACLLHERFLNKLIAFILVILSLSMISSHLYVIELYPTMVLTGLSLQGIGVIAAILGVAGGEFLIPTLMLLYGFDMKIAGTLSLCISLPTMIVAFIRYSRNQVFSQLKEHKKFILFMVIGSFAGSLIGAYALQFIHSEWLVWILGIILMLSAIKVFSHSKKSS